MTTEEFSNMALSFPGAEDKPHFDRTAFKVVKRRTFATLHEPSRSANIVLSPSEQSQFCELGAPGIYPVPNKWGERGWTTFELTEVSQDIIQAALETAYQAVLKNRKKS